MFFLKVCSIDYCVRCCCCCCCCYCCSSSSSHFFYDPMGHRTRVKSRLLHNAAYFEGDELQ